AEAFAAAFDGAIVVETLAKSRSDYLMNPDRGRALGAASSNRLPKGPFDAVLVIADGLSSTAIAAHGVALAKLILAGDGLRWAPVIVVRNGRVAIGDAIAAAIGAETALVMIGERPGLSAADSVGLYLTRRPQPGLTKDAERNCISNIRPGGLKLEDAVNRLHWLIAQSRKLGLTGVGLKEDAPESLPDHRSS
ncbi:MAG: ethanolamine ammonia-lyase light chain EutC, partial [Alphaproteobacteria bacterium]|nr:ethanolamine ammonia-lyase light chain EutC [Alphaproteobacteria bacterium]